MDTNTLSAVTSGLTFLGIVFEFTRRYFTEKAAFERARIQREWDIEDRKVKAEELAAHLATETARLEAASVARSAKVIDKISENTEVSVKAFNEANAVNEKLLKVHEDVKKAVELIPQAPVMVNIGRVTTPPEVK